MMLNDPESLVYYIEYTTLWALLDEAGGFQDIGFATEFDSAMMDAFAEEERTAPPIEIPAVSKKSQEDEKPTEIKKVHPKVSKFSIVSLAMSSAALLFVIVYAHFVSMRRGIETATLTDSMNAKWADIASPVEKGTRLVTGEKRWLLREGYAELLFDNQARVVLEGPAEFQILAEDRVGLSYGKVYARVPQTAGGFSVYTPNAKIIDLGTEFGVQVEIGGNTQLHVLKGKTMLMAGKTDRVNMEVSQGNARKISGE
ncbi:MAG TPA: FecR family protein, partial [Anaerohalosphaeraceae bacterium]|nr:FecR family protein [Anaerohalosphaeraceae bacterium]